MRKMEKSGRPANAPEPALLDYLGRYADAADGLDPLGMALPDEGAATRDDGPERQP